MVLGGQHHGQGAKFPLEWVEDEAESFKRYGAQKYAVVLLAENDRRRAFLPVEPEQRMPHATLYFRAVCQQEAARGSGLDP